MKSLNRAFYFLKKLIISHQFILYIILFIISFIFLIWLQASPSFPDPDSFYHSKITKLMSEQGVIYDFPWLQSTIFTDHYIDHHFLYHVFLMPFVIFLEPAIGAKLGHAVLAAFTIITFFCLLRQFKVKGGFYYSLILLLCGGFVFRLSLVKAQPLALILLFISIYLILKKRYWLLMVLSFLYVWSYNGWFIILVLSSLSVLLNSFYQAIPEDWQDYFNFPKLRLIIINIWKKIWQKDNWKLMGSVVIGLILGIIINPYFPQNLYFYWVHIVIIGLINLKDQIGVGAEWYPMGFGQLIKNLIIPLILVMFSFGFYFNFFKKYSFKVFYILMIMLLFLYATIRSQRNIEYLTPIMIIFAAFVLTETYNQKIQQKLIQPVKKYIKFILQEQALKKVLIVFFIVCFISFIVQFSLMQKSFFSGKYQLDYLKNSAQFLQENSQPGDIVFHSNWDEPLMLFYHNHYNYYIVALDPTFMYMYDPDLHQKWVDISRGERAEQVYDIIKNEFNAKYVLITVDHEEMKDVISHSFGFKQVYEDEEAIIFEVE